MQINLIHKNIHQHISQNWFTIRNRKKSPNQETGLGNRGHLKVMNDTKLVLNVSSLRLFFAVSYSEPALSSTNKVIKTPKLFNCPLYLLSLDINVILQILHVASSSNEDESSDMESFEFAICFRDLKCAFKLKPYLVSKLHTSQLYLPTALPSISR